MTVSEASGCSFQSIWLQPWDQTLLFLICQDPLDPVARHNSDPGVLSLLTQTSSLEVLVSFSSLQDLFQTDQPATASMGSALFEESTDPVSLSGTKSASSSYLGQDPPWGRFSPRGSFLQSGRLHRPPHSGRLSVLQEPVQAVSWVANGPKVQAAREVTGRATAGELLLLPPRGWLQSTQEE